MSIGFQKTDGSVSFQAPIATWLQILTTLALAASVYFRGSQQNTDDSANLKAKDAIIQQKLDQHDKELSEIRSYVAKIDGKLEVIVSIQQSNQKQK